MSESSDDTVSLAKDEPAAAPARPSRPGRPARADVPRVPIPRSVDLVTLAAGVLALAMWVRSLGLIGNDSKLLAYVKKANHDSKSPDKHFTADDAAKAVHNLRIGGVFTGVMVTLVVLLLVWAMRRTRTGSVSRWGVLIFFVLLQLPFYVVPTSGLPVLTQGASVLVGIASIAAIVLVFVPQSATYFRACRDAMTPPELRGQPRPGLGSLFKPRPPAGGAARTPATRPGARTPAATRPSVSKAKAKVRTDADAVSRGAELARSRAKTSKSRRSE